MTKDAYYFSHDSNARHDPKILSMRSVYGSEGYGWYWILIEMMREQENYQIEINKYVWNALAMQAQCNADAMHKFVDDCINEFSLFSSDGEKFWSESLKRRMEIRSDKSEKARKAAEARWKKTSNSNDSEACEDDKKNENADAMQTHSERNAIKGKEIRKESKDIKDYMSEIKKLMIRYPEGFIELNKAYWNVIQETRTSKKIQPSVIYKTMEKWSEFPVPVVEYALKRHLEIAAKDKDEKYTIGIMRKTTKEEALDKLDRMIPKRGVNKHETTQYDNLF